MSNLSEIVKEAIENKGVTLEKVSEATDVPLNYLKILLSGDYKSLPPAPYVRGYLLKIARVFRLDGEELWRSYKNDLSLKVSGKDDKLSENRYALTESRNKKFIWFFLILMFVIVYLASQWSNIFGSPRLEIINPATSETIVSSSSIKLSGRIDPKDKLLINDEEIVADTSGWFEKDFDLATGTNPVEFKVKRFLGKEITITRQIYYQQ